MVPVLGPEDLRRAVLPLEEESRPFMPSSIETQAAPTFGMIAVIEKGLTRSGPRLISVSQASSNDLRPPIAVATRRRPHEPGRRGSVNTGARVALHRTLARPICRGMLELRQPPHRPHRAL